MFLRMTSALPPCSSEPSTSLPSPSPKPPLPYWREGERVREGESEGWTYHIVGNFGEVFNLANWRFCRKLIAKFKTCQCILMTGLPNLTLVKVSHYTILHRDIFSLFIYLFLFSCPTTPYPGQRPESQQTEN